MYKLETSINNSISLNTIIIIYSETKFTGLKWNNYDISEYYVKKTIIIKIIIRMGWTSENLKSLMCSQLVL